MTSHEVEGFISLTKSRSLKVELMRGPIQSQVTTKLVITPQRQTADQRWIDEIRPYRRSAPYGIMEQFNGHQFSFISGVHTELNAHLHIWLAHLRGVEDSISIFTQIDTMVVLLFQQLNGADKSDK